MLGTALPSAPGFDLNKKSQGGFHVIYEKSTLAFLHYPKARHSELDSESKCKFTYEIAIASAQSLLLLDPESSSG